MGRPPRQVDAMALLDLAERGLTYKEMASELGIAPGTLMRRIADIQEKQNLLIQYRGLQSLQLTELQARILEAITPEKINDASLKDLTAAFKILKDSERVIEGKPTEIKGLLGYLVQIEKEELAERTGAKSNTLDVVAEEEEDAEYVPNL